MLKKLIALLLAIVCSFSLVTVGAFAAEPEDIVIAEPILNAVKVNGATIENIKKEGDGTYSYSIRYGENESEAILQAKEPNEQTLITISRGAISNTLLYQSDTLISVDGIALPHDNMVTMSPKGNLASIYYSTTPFYGTSSLYKYHDYNDYDVEFVNRLNTITKTAFSIIIGQFCPPLGAAMDALDIIATTIGILYDGLVGNVVTAPIQNLYIRESCYVPPVQPTPTTVVYTKYVVRYYTDASRSDKYEVGDPTTYYTKLVYNLYA